MAKEERKEIPPPAAPDDAAILTSVKEGIKKAFALIAERTKLEARLVEINKILDPYGIDAPASKSASSKSSYVTPTDSHVPQIIEFLGKESKPLAVVCKKFNFHHKALLKFWVTKGNSRQQKDKSWTISNFSDR